MFKFSLLNHATEKYVTFPFYKNAQPLTGGFPVCGITLRAAGSMRFRWNETNPVRDEMLSSICKDCVPVPVQLNHTHIVYKIESPKEIDQKIGDGIITSNKKIMPVVTVADCVPIYLFEPKSGVFGIVHSGWKGTGIAQDAINLACLEYHLAPQDFCAVIGPHIQDCCYIVDKNRAEFFKSTFSPDCVSELEQGVKVDWNNGDGPLFRLSLEKANLCVLKKAGVPDENIAVCTDCTSCNEIYGSNRRETKIAGKPDAFTVQAAFVLNKS